MHTKNLRYIMRDKQWERTETILRVFRRSLLVHIPSALRTRTIIARVAFLRRDEREKKKKKKKETKRDEIYIYIYTYIKKKQKTTVLLDR